jgi:hypothetical protein
MIINGKRYQGIQVFKKKGLDVYVMTVDIERYHGSGFMMRPYWITPFWSDVTTSDLKAQWAARFFSELISSTHFDIGEGERLEGQSDYCYPVAWSQIPTEWKKLFRDGLHFLDISTPSED